MCYEHRTHDHIVPTSYDCDIHRRRVVWLMQIICGCTALGWLFVNGLVGCGGLVGWWVGGLAGWLVGWLFGWLVRLFLRWLVENGHRCLSMVDNRDHDKHSQSRLVTQSRCSFHVPQGWSCCSDSAAQKCWRFLSSHCC